MTVGTGIFWGSLLLSGVILFGITKDRWNWRKIIRFSALALLAICILASGLFLWMHVEDVRQVEESQRNQQREEEAASVKAQRDAKARLCIADDLPRMEGLAGAIQHAIHEDMKLDEVKLKLDALSGSPGRVAPTKEDIKDRVLIYHLHTKCDSPFNLLVNVRADSDGALKWLSVFAEDVPEGYPSGRHREFSASFIHEPADTRLANLTHTAPPRTRALFRSEGVAAVLPNGTNQIPGEDPCAPDLRRNERLRRLAQLGTVRETGGATYEAAGHSVSFFPESDTLISCR